MQYDKKTTIIFDFDMTLVDTSRGSAIAYQSAFKAAGGTYDENSLMEYMSEFLDKTYKRILNPRISFKDFCSSFYLKSHNHMAEHSRLSPRIIELLDRLSDSNKRLAIVTNKDRATLIKIMESQDLNRYSFECIVTCDDVRNYKPHPEGLILCINQIGVPPNECLYVGDSQVDLQFARNAQIDGIILNGIYPMS